MRHNSNNSNESSRDNFMVSLPVPIDTRKYLIGRIAFVDVLIASPFVLITALFLYILYQLDYWSSTAVIVICVPAVVAILAQLTKHPVRREISYIEYGVLWKLFYRKRQKEFYKRKGAINMEDTQDSRKVLGVKGVYLGCYETPKSLVRVFEVSSVNLSLANKSEKRDTLESFRVFLTSLEFTNQLQFCKIAQPISLDRHLENFKKNKRTGDNADVKAMLQKSYENHMNELGKNRNLVARKNYIVLSQPIKNKDKQKALLEIDTKSAILIQKLSSLTMSRSSLSVHQLDDEELTLLLHTTIDYDSAVSVGRNILKRTRSGYNVSMDEESARNLIVSLERAISHDVN